MGETGPEEGVSEAHKARIDAWRLSWGYLGPFSPRRPRPRRMLPWMDDDLFLEYCARLVVKQAPAWRIPLDD